MREYQLESIVKRPDFLLHKTQEFGFYTLSPRKIHNRATLGVYREHLSVMLVKCVDPALLL